MDVLVESKTIPVTDALRALAVKQARRISRLGARVLRIRVIFETIGKKRNDAQATMVQFLVELPGRDVVVRRRARDLYQALIDAAHHTARQVRRAKEKRINLRRQPHLELVDVGLTTS